MYISDPLQLVSGENINSDDIQYLYENQDEHAEAEGQGTDGATWNENSSLADVVKSILGPNQEGPVILHVNNYDGVAVVQVADPQSYTTLEEQEQEALPENNQSEGGIFLFFFKLILLYLLCHPVYSSSYLGEDNYPRRGRGEGYLIEYLMFLMKYLGFVLHPCANSPPPPSFHFSLISWEVLNVGVGLLYSAEYSPADTVTYFAFCF